MRHVFLVVFVLGAGLAAQPALASQIGLPTDTFVLSWTALPTGHFANATLNGPYKASTARVAPLPDARLAPVLDEAFASARDETERRDIALSAMTAPWDQPKRTAFQRLREAEAAYAGTDGTRTDRFVATLTRVVDGTGRSAAVEGSSSVDLDKVYATALARAPGDARVAAEAEQERWRTYSDAFATFADLQTPGSAAGVTDELERQRVSDLAIAGR